MIFFVAPSEDTWAIAEYLQQSGRDPARWPKTVTYGEIVERGRLSLGTYIFAGLDRLTRTEREIAGQCCEALRRASPDIRLINRPTEVLLRYELLEASFERRRNTFRAHRPWEMNRCRRFPVFVRPEREHLGSLTPRLHNRRELAVALAATVLRGFRLRDLIIVEYCDTADPCGVYRAYSAVRVGDRIMPKNLIHNRDWITKWDGRLIDADKAREQLEFVEGDPHAAWLRETFDLARISYGRIDYAVKDGVPQVWEINTNPTLARRIGAPSTVSPEQWSIVAPVQEGFVRRFEAALDEIDSDVDPGRAVPIEITPRQARRLEAETRRRRRLLARNTAISRAARLPIRLARRLGASWTGFARRPGA
jgi:hypothetical protein